MIECILAWALLVAAALTGDTEILIASALFALAAQVSRIVDAMDEGEDGA